ncbi:hypothetical protein ACI79C_13165 [Geodermatophilus sp. SYSU D00697]
MGLTDDLALGDLSVDGGNAVSTESEPRDAGALFALDVIEFEQAGVSYRAAVVPVKAAVRASAFQLDGVNVGHIPGDDRLVERAHPILVDLRPFAHFPVVRFPVALSMATGIFGWLAWISRDPGGAHKRHAGSAVVLEAIPSGVVHPECFARLPGLAFGANLRGFCVRLHEPDESIRGKASSMLRFADLTTIRAPLQCEESVRERRAAA